MIFKTLFCTFLCYRYAWEHAILREDINSRRVCLAFRELTTAYLPNGSHNQEAKAILEQAMNFW